MTGAGGDAPLAAVRRLAPASPEEVLRRLELNVNRRLDGLLHGDYQGLLPGHGSEPGEARRYEPGDDVRRIDWNVTARQQTPYIRESIADRELEAWLVVDASPSLDFGTADMEKRDLALAAAAAIGLLVARAGNRTGAVISRPDGIAVRPARQGRQHLLALLSTIQSSPRGSSDATRGAGPQAGLGALLDRTMKVARRRGMVAVVSDFLDDPSTWKRSLTTLTHRHDVLCLELVDPRELELPDVGILAVVDPETGRRREVDTSNTKLRRRYAAAALEQRSAITSTIRSAGAAQLRLRTDGDWLGDIVRHVSERKRRAVNMGAPRAAAAGVRP